LLVETALTEWHTMEQLVSRLKLAKENALARRAKDEEAKRMARKRKRHESYVRKKQTASLELSKQEQTGEPQRKTTGIQDESQNEVRIKKKQQPVKKKSVKQNIEPSEIHTKNCNRNQSHKVLLNLTFMFKSTPNQKLHQKPRHQHV